MAIPACSLTLPVQSLYQRDQDRTELRVALRLSSRQNYRRMEAFAACAASFNSLLTCTKRARALSAWPAMS